MAKAYVQTKTTKFVTTAPNTPNQVLIYGDEVETDGNAASGAASATVRGREGTVAAKALGSKPALEVYFIDVGTGDSTFIVTPGRKKILVDGGLNHRAKGFLSWKYMLDDPANSVSIDLLVLSHADDDHVNGLVPIISHPRITVGRIVHSGIATFKKGAFATELGDLDASGKRLTTRHSKLTDLEGASLSDDFQAWKAAVGKRKIPYEAVDSRSGGVDVGDSKVSLEVLGPRLSIGSGGAEEYEWFADKPHTINGHSVVLKLTVGDVSLLLTGDVNTDACAHLMAAPAIAARLDSHVLKCPHHGSHEFSPAFLEAVRPQISVVSSGDDRDHGHPRAVFVAALGRASRSKEPLVFSTEIAGRFVEAGTAPPGPGDGATLEGTDVTTPEGNKTARMLFKRSLHGMINVRSDGKNLYAARRVAASYQWESYGPLPAAPKPSLLGDH